MFGPRSGPMLRPRSGRMFIVEELKENRAPEERHVNRLNIALRWSAHLFYVPGL